jgi:16S rRNA (guanine966-N2)-methyltransferase
MKHTRSRSPARRVVGSRNEVRIIAGRWRGRRIDFPDGEGLRPTPDRVRETVFNWLQPVIMGARCLDLFAGSGALGFESLSRGAAATVFVERERKVCQQLRATAATLGADGATIECSDALQWLEVAPPSAFDIVFLDPPFASTVLSGACHLLASKGWLAPDANIYIEARADAPLSMLPPTWRILRSKRAGQVGYHLARCSPPTASSD